MNILKIVSATVVVACLFAGRGMAQDELPPAGDLLKVLDQESLFADWPGVEETVDQAIKFLPEALRDARSWETRQKMAALIPSFRYQHAVDEDNFSRSDVVNDPANRGRIESLRLTDGVRDYSSDIVSLTWDLSRFVFDIDEVEGAQVERELEDFRRKVRAETVSAYYELREMKTRVAQGYFAEKQDRLDAETEARKLQALLDVYTGGYFSEFIHQTEQARAGATPAE